MFQFQIGIRQPLVVPTLLSSELPTTYESHRMLVLCNILLKLFLSGVAAVTGFTEPSSWKREHAAYSKLT